MIKQTQSLRIAKEFVKDACNALGMNENSVSIKITSEFCILPSAMVDPVNYTITISEKLLKQCCSSNGFTPLRTDIYSKVRMLDLAFNPAKCITENIVFDSLLYATALMMRKGLQLPIPCIPDFANGVKQIFKSEFNLDVEIVKTSKSVNEQSIYMARLIDGEAKRYYQRTYPLPAKSTVQWCNHTGTKENPFEDVYQAIDFIREKEKQAHDNDILLQEIENEKYFYDLRHGCFRIHWASPHVSQYQNILSSKVFFVNQMDSGFFSFKPNLYQHKFLYRGQSDCYDGKPCVPNLFRNPGNNAKGDYLEFLIFSQEMELLINSHPLVKLLNQGIELLHDTFCFRMNTMGLAQHYYNKSHYLDLTSDLDVLKFFATTDYDWKTDSFSPHLETDSLGVIYCYELQYPTAFQQHNGYALKTIGKQMFMRPGAQCGFLLEMEKGVDLKNLPEVKAVYFEHNPEVSKEIFKQSNHGSDYFATDILEHAWHDRLCKRRDERIVAKQTVAYNAQLNNTTVQDISDQLISMGFTIDDMALVFSQEELDMYYESIQNGWWEQFCEDVHFYGAEDELYRQALRDIIKDPKYRSAFFK